MDPIEMCCGVAGTPKIAYVARLRAQFCAPPLHMARIAPAILLHSRRPWRSDVQVPRSTRQGLFLTILLHSRHCTWTCRCREAQDVRERPSMAVRCARAAAPCRARPGTVSLRRAINSQTLSKAKPNRLAVVGLRVKRGQTRFKHQVTACRGYRLAP